jgi:hypothetical protein
MTLVVRCVVCCAKANEWHAKHGRRRRLGRIVVRAMRAYIDGGGEYADFTQLALNDEIVELTSELLADVIRLTHPDQHLPERRELAERATEAEAGRDQDRDRFVILMCRQQGRLPDR